MAAHDLTVEFPSTASLLAQEPHLEQTGFFLPIPEPAPQANSTVTLHVGSATGEWVVLQGRVVHLFVGAGMGITFEDLTTARDALEPMLATARGATEPGDTLPAKVSWGAPQIQDKSTPEDASTLHDRLRAMSTSEKIQLALHGGRAERLLLIKDNNKTIHSFIIKNPRITLDEVKSIAGNRQTSPDVFNAISGNRVWMQNPAIVLALVRNPKTPSTLATRLLDKLPVADLQRLARSQNVPRQVQQAARRKYEKNRK